MIDHTGDIMWLYKGKEISVADEDYIGFVYLITNLINGKKYIGKKLFKHSKTKVKKGKKKKFLVESDWKTYYGSNFELLEDVHIQGEKSFRREILHFCKTKGTCSYLELKEQILHNSLEDPLYYNQQIRARIHSNHIKL